MSLSYTKTGVGSLPEQGGNPRTLTGRPAGPGPAGGGKQASWGASDEDGCFGGIHSHNKAAEDQSGSCATTQVVAADLCLYVDYAYGWVGSMGAQDGPGVPLKGGPGVESPSC